MPTPLPRGVLWIVLAGAAVRLVIAAAVPLTVDEAYYAQWAAHLQAGYLDHPPLVGWLMAAGLGALGHSTLAARLPAVLLQAATTLLAADLAGRRGGPRAAWIAALALQAAPVFSLGAMLMTPDAPLAFAWVGVLWSLERAASVGPRWLLAAGAFLGVAALSKLTAGPLALACLAALATTLRGRALLATPWPWVGALLAAALASPVLLWNAEHAWANVAFQAQHGLRGRSFSLARLTGSLGGQAAYVSPVLLVACLPPAWRALRSGDPALRAIAWSGLPVVGFFTISAALTPGALPHWPTPGWLSAMLLFAIGSSTSPSPSPNPNLNPTRSSRIAFLRAGLVRPALATGFALQLAAALLAFVPVELAGDPRDEVRGWREGAEAARAAAGAAPLAVAHWITLGQLGWFAGGPVVYVGTRPCAASLYDPDPLARGGPLLVVTVDGLGPKREDLERRLGPLEPAGGYEARHRGRLVRRFAFWRWAGPAPAAATAAAPAR